MPIINRFGDTNLPALVLLHGFLGSKEDWQASLQILSQHFHCICIDLPGHGDNQLELPTPGFETAAQSIVDKVIQLGYSQFHLLGYSLGGRIALHIAKLYPKAVLSLLLESAHLGLTSSRDKQARLKHDQKWADKLAVEPIRDFLEQWYQQPVFANLTTDARKNLIAIRSKNNPQALLHCFKSTSLGLQQNGEKVLKQLHCPAYLLVGEQDSKFSQLAQQWQQKLQLNTVTISHCGHNIHKAQPKMFAARIIQLLTP
ncbi:2-succinyl-6-hydroxy-2,4-cyclohexadiene-1-carboxylate synthase [Shewanella sp. 6_MG-2023]|uniref:2-succinyl-6-hydroxy-2, 4-cyclohexadiene-1-carboxylate synthase n=1 Tax=Shewanella sp. 6_MG-2023 TaxID=3062660 RepID=UPI0026E3B07C|nr:2-succinyl-6-hydroxy-2,4-cyclohexadiene-1-carboxylate synthase [Shewanella sp. 6_MG-2023]MDO6618417.1 2-succinyl-6-hydroxy-2,4-cyclohexadiene-1-carboxylate synthase [Shewanella sp. 6_MG-2023]